MTEPGILHIETHFPEGDTIVLYDSDVTSSKEILAFLTEKYPKWACKVIKDQPLLG